MILTNLKFAVKLLSFTLLVFNWERFSTSVIKILLSHPSNLFVVMEQKELIELAILMNQYLKPFLTSVLIILALDLGLIFFNILTLKIKPATLKPRNNVFIRLLFALSNTIRALVVWPLVLLVFFLSFNSLKTGLYLLEIDAFRLVKPISLAEKRVLYESVYLKEMALQFKELKLIENIKLEDYNLWKRKRFLEIKNELLDMGFFQQFQSPSSIVFKAKAQAKEDLFECLNMVLTQDRVNLYNLEKQRSLERSGSSFWFMAFQAALAVSVVLLFSAYFKLDNQNASQEEAIKTIKSGLEATNTKLLSKASRIDENTWQLNGLTRQFNSLETRFNDLLSEQAAAFANQEPLRDTGSQQIPRSLLENMYTGLSQLPEPYATFFRAFNPQQQQRPTFNSVVYRGDPVIISGDRAQFPSFSATEGAIPMPAPPTQTFNSIEEIRQRVSILEQKVACLRDNISAFENSVESVIEIAQNIPPLF